MDDIFPMPCHTGIFHPGLQNDALIDPHVPRPFDTMINIEQNNHPTLSKANGLPQGPKALPRSFPAGLFQSQSGDREVALEPSSRVVEKTSPHRPIATADSYDAASGCEALSRQAAATGAGQDRPDP